MGVICRPGGLQLGHYLLQAGRDYVTFESQGHAGSFFDRYPVHRQLISLNKRFTGRNEPEFNLRHGQPQPCFRGCAHVFTTSGAYSTLRPTHFPSLPAARGPISSNPLPLDVSATTCLQQT